jgi:hypothetical protein
MSALPMNRRSRKHRLLFPPCRKTLETGHKVD